MASSVRFGVIGKSCVTLGRRCEGLEKSRENASTKKNTDAKQGQRAIVAWHKVKNSTE